MRTKNASTIRSCGALLAVLALAGDPAPADEPGTFEGRFLLGFRSVSVDGTENKYKEDINLDDGPRLFDLSFRFAPGEGADRFADSIELDILNAGGDPYESFRLEVRKFGGYQLRYSRQKSDYFYQDTILPPELADVSLSSGGDFHHFDVERVRESAKLDITLSPRADLTFGFDRFTRAGETTTTLDIQRDEFELDKPIEESLDDYHLGFQYAWDKVTLTLEEQVRDYESSYEIFAPGFTEGENTTNAANLAFFFLDQPYDLKSNTHRVRVVAKPTSNWILRGAASFQSLEMDIEADERSAGTGFNGQPFTTDLSGAGQIDRDIDLFDFDLTYRINERVAVVGGLWQRSLDQQGQLAFDGRVGQGVWDIETSGAEAGVQFIASSQLQVTLGTRVESRDVEHGWNDDGKPTRGEEDTDSDGYFATAAWNPKKACRVTLDLEQSSYDDPFTLSAPTDRTRARLQGSYRLENGLSLNGSYVFNSYENDASGWDAGNDQLTLRLGYAGKGIHASVGYGMVSIDRAIDQTVVTLPGFGGGQELFFPIAYQADSDFLDGRVRVKLAASWTLGFDGRLYENSGSFALERSDLRAYAEYAFKEGYLVRAGFRTVDYDEDSFDFDDYDADILELGLGYRW